MNTPLRPLVRNDYPNFESTQHRDVHHHNDYANYHRPLNEVHHAALHGWGIAYGLEIHFQAADVLNVSPGVAIDSLGRMIVLAPEVQQGHWTPEAPDDANRVEPSEVHSTPVALTRNHEQASSGDWYLTIQYAEVKYDEGSVDRIEVVPSLRLQPKDSVATDGIVVVLATLKADGSLSPENRQRINQPTGEVTIQRSTSANGTLAEVAAGKIGSGDNGGLVISVPQTDDIVKLSSESENGHFAQLDVQAEATHLSGTLDVAGTVNSRDIAADGQKLDSHIADVNNPHKVTAQQTKSLPISGGTLSGPLTVQGNITTTGKVDGRDLSIDGKKLDSHTADKKNPHQVTAQQIKALSISGGTLTGPLSVKTVKGDTEIDGKLQVTGEVTVNKDLVLGQLVQGETGRSEYGNKLHFLGAKWNGDPVWIARYVWENDYTSLRVNIGDNAIDKQDKFEVGSENWKDDRNFKTWWYVDHDGGHTASDIRRKTQVSTITAGLDTVMQLRGVEFCWRDQTQATSDTPKKLGVIAQEIEAIIPNAVSTDSEGYKFVNYNAIIPILIEAIKEQQAQLEQQQVTLAALTNK